MLNNVYIIYYTAKPATLLNEAYYELLKMKENGMSFSDVILEPVKRNNNISNFKTFAGSLRDESNDLDSFKNSIMNDRNINMK